MNNHVNDNRNYTDYPFVGVGVVAWRKDKFILIQRAKPPLSGKWSLPGGRQELGETTKEAAYREVMEETRSAERSNEGEEQPISGLLGRLTFWRTR